MSLSQYLVEQILLTESKITRVICIFSGRFQPFHSGHYHTYSQLVKKFGKSNVYIGTSDKTDSTTSPFNFKEKSQIITTMFGVSKDKVVQIKNPYKPTEILSKFDKDTTAYITVVGEKDASRLGGKYFQKYDGNPDTGYETRGYIYISPKQSNPISGTDVRNNLSVGSYEDKKDYFEKTAYTKFNPKIFDLVTSKLEERLIITKDVIEEWLLNESSAMTSGQADDGPGSFTPNYDVFKKISAKRAAKIGYEVMNMIMTKDLEDYYEHPKYPKGPTAAVSYYPAGVIGAKTTTNQFDVYSSKAYSSWFKHVTRKASLAGYTLVYTQIERDAAMKLKKMSGDDAKGDMVSKKEYEKSINEIIKIPVEIGDTILTGKFKNKKTVVKSIGEDEHGMPTINGKKVVTFRFGKKAPNIFESIVELEEDVATMLKEGNDKLKSDEQIVKFGKIIGKDFKKLVNHKLSVSGNDAPDGVTGIAVKQWMDAEETKKYLGESIITEETITSFKQLFSKLPSDLQKRIMDLKNLEQDPEHHPEGNVLKHTIVVVNRALKNNPGDIDLALAAIFHDIGKDSTASSNVKTKRIQHLGHDETSAELVKKYASFILKMGGKPSDVFYIVKNHMRMKDFDVMKLSKKRKLTNYRAFDKLDTFNKKLDGGGFDESVNEGYVLQDLEKKYNIELELYDNGDYLSLDKIIIPKSERGSGLGTKIMKQLTDYSDKVKKPIYLTPSVDYGASSVSRLTQFYKSFGFVKNTDKSKTKASMVRVSEMAKADLDKIEKYAEKQLSPEDIEFGNHFFERLNDKRNGKEISVAELTGFFKRLAKHKKQFKEFLEKYQQLVVKDKRHDINIPFMTQSNQIIAKTIMRKKEFKTPNKVITIETVDSMEKLYADINSTLDSFSKNESRVLVESPKWTSSVFELILDGYVPLTDSMMKRILGDIDVNAWHSTDLNNLGNLVSLQGKKKSISTFDAADLAGRPLDGTGMWTDGNILVLVHGTLLARNYVDLMSKPDKQGRRWIWPKIMFGSDVDMTKLRDVKKMKSRVHNGEEIGGKEKAEFIKSYIDKAYKQMYKNRFKFMKTIIENGTKLNYTDDWNEVVMNNIMILHIYIMGHNASDEIIEKVKEKYSNFSITVVNSREEMARIFKKSGSKLREEILTEGVTRSYENDPKLRELRSETGLKYGFGNKETMAKIAMTKNWTSTDDKDNFQLYTERVRRLTNDNYQTYFTEINEANKRSRDHHLDHKYSISDGFKNNIPIEVISHYKNLEIINGRLNESKGTMSNILLKDLINDIQNSKNPLDRRTLLMCGGTWGHMNHPFDTDINLTFGQLKDIVSKGLDGELEVTKEKCISGDSILTTQTNGEITIGEFVDNDVNDKVLSYNENTNSNEYMDVFGKFNNDVTDEWLEIELEDGRTIEVTPNHRIFVDGKYIEARYLVEGMDLKINS